MKMHLAIGEQNIPTLEQNTDNGNPESGIVQSTGVSYDEYDYADGRPYTQKIITVDSSAGNFDSFSRRFIAQFGDLESTQGDKFYQADTINLVRRLRNPDSNHFTIPVKEEFISDFFFAFEQTIGVRQSELEKYPNQEYYKVELRFDNGQVNASQLDQLETFVRYIDSKTDGNPTGSKYGADFLTLYHFAKEQIASAPATPVDVQPETPATPEPQPEAPTTGEPDPLAGLEPVQPDTSSTSIFEWKPIFDGSTGGIAKVPSMFFDNYAVASDLDNVMFRQVGDQDFYRDVVLEVVTNSRTGNNEQVVQLSTLESIRDNVLNSAPWSSILYTDYSDFFTNTADKQSAYHAADQAIRHFQNSTIGSETRYIMENGVEVQANVYVDPNPYSGIIVIELESDDGEKAVYAYDSRDGYVNKPGYTELRNDIGAQATAAVKDIHAKLAQEVATSVLFNVRPDVFAETFGSIVTE